MTLNRERFFALAATLGLNIITGCTNKTESVRTPPADKVDLKMPPTPEPVSILHTDSLKPFRFGVIKNELKNPLILDINIMMKICQDPIFKMGFGPQSRVGVGVVFPDANPYSLEQQNQDGTEMAKIYNAFSTQYDSVLASATFVSTSNLFRAINNRRPKSEELLRISSEEFSIAWCLGMKNGVDKMSGVQNPPQSLDEIQLKTIRELASLPITLTTLAPEYLSMIMQGIPS